MGMFVDNIKIIRSKRSRVIQKVKDGLTAIFLMVDMGPISFYLDLKVERDQEKRTIKLFQLAYIDKVLEKYHLDKPNAVNTPMKETELLMLKTNSRASPSERETYHGIIDLLMFLMMKTRSDISFATSVASRLVKNLSR